MLAQQASGVPAHLPLFTTLLNYRHSQPRGARPPGAQGAGIEIVAAGQDRTNYPLGVSVDDTGTGFGLSVACVAPADPQQVCALLRTCLENLVTLLDTAPATPLHAVQVLSEPERAQLVTGWNDTTAPVPAATVRGSSSRRPAPRMRWRCAATGRC